MTIKSFNEIALKKHCLIKELLLNGVLIPKLLNNPSTSCFLINFDFLLLNIVPFDNIIVLPLPVPEMLGFIFVHFFYTLKNDIILFYT